MHYTISRSWDSNISCTFSLALTPTAGSPPNQGSCGILDGMKSAITLIEHYHVSTQTESHRRNSPQNTSTLKQPARHNNQSPRISSPQQLRTHSQETKKEKMSFAISCGTLTQIHQSILSLTTQVGAKLKQMQHTLNPRKFSPIDNRQLLRFSSASLFSLDAAQQWRQ
jgi:hypothetical protein